MRSLAASDPAAVERVRSSPVAGQVGRPRAAGARTPQRRRAPYPVSPDVGPQGIRACEEMIEAARLLFVERGYHGTSALAVAESTGRSDTAFYQYFGSKLEVFRILFEELGRDLVEHYDTLAELADGPAGLAEFRGWLEGLGRILRRHSPTFAQWPLYAEDEPPVANPSEAYIRQLADRFDTRLVVADASGIDTGALSVSVITLVEWAHVVLGAWEGAADPAPEHAAALHDALARVIHRSLFPSLDGGREPGGLARVPPVPWPHSLRDRDEPTFAVPGLRKPVTARTLRTVRKIMDAAVKALERRGLTGASVNDVVTEASVGHGTFYQYWVDRTAMFTTLAYEAAVVTCSALTALLEVETEAGLDAWLDSWLDVVRRHGTVFHIWATEVLDHPPLWSVARELRDHYEQVAAKLLERWLAPPEFEPRTAAVVLWTLLAELPYNAWVRYHVLTRDQVLNCQRLVLTRGLLGLTGSSG